MTDENIDINAQDAELTQGSESETEEGESSEEDQVVMTQKQFDNTMKTRIKRALDSREKELKEEFDKSFDEKLQAKLEEAKERWFADKAEADGAEAGKKQDTDKIIQDEVRRLTTTHKSEVKTLKSENTTLIQERDEAMKQAESLLVAQKRSVVKTALIDGKIDPDLVDTLMPSIIDRITYSQEHGTFLVLEENGGPDDIMFNLQHEEHGLMEAEHFIKNVWAKQDKLIRFRTDFKPGPGLAQSQKGGRTANNQNRSALDKIRSGLQNLDA